MQIAQKERIDGKWESNERAQMIFGNVEALVGTIGWGSKLLTGGIHGKRLLWPEGSRWKKEQEMEADASSNDVNAKRRRNVGPQNNTPPLLSTKWGRDDEG